MSWICEAIGCEEFTKEFNTREEAIAEKERFVKQFEEDYEISEEYYSDVREVTEFGYEWANMEDYQVCFTYKKPESLKEEMLLELTKADFGMTQYSFELQDTWTCREHIDKLRELIEKMEEN